MKAFFLLFVSLFSSITFATDRLYLRCDPEENCVVQRIGPITVENPACVARRALCRIKCRQLNDDADRYIREDQAKIAIIDQQIIQQQNQLSDSFVRQSEYQNQINNFTSEMNTVKNLNTIMIEQLQIYKNALTSLKIKIQNNQFSLNEIDKLELTTQENELLQLFVTNYGNDLLAINQLFNTNNNDLILNLQFKSLEQYVRLNLIINKMQINFENEKNVNLQIQGNINDLKEQRKKLVDHIQEQVDRKCPANLI